MSSPQPQEQAAYKVVDIGSTEAAMDFHLNQLARLGWDLVQVVGPTMGRYYIGIFTRAPRVPRTTSADAMASALVQ
jgi:hypothetical protein